MKQSDKSNILLKELERNSFLSFNIYHPCHPIYYVQEHTLTMPAYCESIVISVFNALFRTQHMEQYNIRNKKCAAYGISSTTNDTAVQQIEQEVQHMKRVVQHTE